ncbi:hypothetical protein FIBSPDRAFT_848691 [Athelia psychrophila]|uniref:Uncharacterized protein n=1 Tax=Athelia psychrophila TaxID=1759441 RepID=A0A166V2V6_9AGAM|nr:hypothetical protein FIBSPDRAFT_848691 [Fibularhizoctonia sp. CBS 109695]
MPGGLQKDTRLFDARVFTGGSLDSLMPVSMMGVYSPVPDSSMPGCLQKDTRLFNARVLTEGHPTLQCQGANGRTPYSSMPGCLQEGASTLLSQRYSGCLQYGSRLFDARVFIGGSPDSSVPVALGSSLLFREVRRERVKGETKRGHGTYLH